MKTQHTPGPWEVRWSERGKYWFIDHEQGGEGYTLTTLACGPQDAQLIAAAPDMLAMLHEVLTLLNDPDADSSDAWRVESKIEAVIAKATGAA